MTETSPDVIDDVSTSRLYLLVTSPRLPAGLLTARAWSLLQTHPVYAGAETEAVAALRACDVPVEILDGTPTEQAASFRLVAHSGVEPVWFAGPTGDTQFATALGHSVVRENGVSGAGDRRPVPELEVVYGSWDPPGARLLDVVAVMDRLRTPGGCPWDAEQTHSSLMPYLLEEAYEAYDAIEANDREAMIEELGDVLLQPVFHARLAEENPEQDRWNIDDVAGALVDKLVRRHPHVFARVPGRDRRRCEAQLGRNQAPRKAANVCFGWCRQGATRTVPSPEVPVKGGEVPGAGHNAEPASPGSMCRMTPSGWVICCCPLWSPPVPMVSMPKPPSVRQRTGSLGRFGPLKPAPRRSATSPTCLPVIFWSELRK